MLREIERFTGQLMAPMKVPSRADVAAWRMAMFKDRLLEMLRENKELESYLALVEDVAEESGRDMTEVAAAAARLARSSKTPAGP